MSSKTRTHTRSISVLVIAFCFLKVFLDMKREINELSRCTFYKPRAEVTASDEVIRVVINALH